MKKSVRNAVDLYINSLKGVGSSPKTISNYSICLDKFCELYGNEVTENLTSQSLVGFEAALREKKSKNHKLLVLRYLKSLKYFIYWCETSSIKVGLESAVIHTRVKRLEKETYEWQRTYHGAYISRSELSKLKLYWEKDDFVSTLYALRNRAIVAILGDTGIRVTELMNMRRSDYKSPYLRIGGRELFLDQNTREILNRYLRVRPDNTEPMFVGYASIEADRIVTQPLGVRGIQRIVKLTGEEVGFEFNISPQTLRNSRIIQTLASKNNDRKARSHLFGLTRNNTSYQRFLETARYLKEEGKL